MAGVLTPERLWAIPRVGTATVGGGRIVVPVTTHDLEENSATTRLWEVFTDGRSPRALTAASFPASSPAGVSASAPVLSADGTRLAFLRTVDDHAQVHMLAMDGGEAERCTDFPLGVRGVRLLPDGHRMVVVADVIDGHFDLDETRAEVERRKEHTTTARTTESAVYRRWDRWLTDGELPHLFLVDGDTVRDLTPTSRRFMRWHDTGGPIDDVDVSADGRFVAWCADRSDPPHTDIRFAVHVTDLEGVAGNERCLTADDPGHASRPRFRPDGSGIVYGRTEDPRFYADRVRLVDHDLGTDARVELLPDWDCSPEAWVFDGDTLLIEAEDDARRPVWTVEDGRVREVARDGTLSGVAPLGDGTLVATRNRLTDPPELVVVSGGDVTALTEFTAEAMAGMARPDVVDVRIAGGDGDEIQLFVVSPPGLDGPAPLVHLIHGGPHGTFGDTWHWRWNALTLAGDDRRLALVNFHGSTSFGQDHTSSILGEWGRLPADDIEAATDHLVAEGWADPARLAITGGSFGGYLVAWLIGHTDRYRCAVAHAAVTDLAGMYASDIPHDLASAHGTSLWDDPDGVHRWSPVTHAAGFSTPTLVIHGELDHRVPVTQGLALYGVLTGKGVPARLVHYPDENHWVTKPGNSLHWYGEVDAWLRRFLTA